VVVPELAERLFQHIRRVQASVGCQQQLQRTATIGVEAGGVGEECTFVP
jgi:hypothetical protein